MVSLRQLLRCFFVQSFNFRRHFPVTIMFSRGIFDCSQSTFAWQHTDLYKELLTNMF